MVQEAFPELGKIRATYVQIRLADDMAPEIPSIATTHLPNALAAVEQEIARACKEANRDRVSVTLIAVSKTFGADAIAPVIEAGQRVFGENRVQEAKTKWPGLISAYPGLALHLIGPLQSNKAKEAVALFDAIHSVDRPSICQALAKEIESQNKRPQLFVQLNTGEEPQKAGVGPSEADAFIASCRDNRRAQRLKEFVDGHERGLRDRDPVRRHPCPRWLRDFWASVVHWPRASV